MTYRHTPTPDEQRAIREAMRERECPNCHGSGRGAAVAFRCNRCSGTGRVRGRVKIWVPVPMDKNEAPSPRERFRLRSDGKWVVRGCVYADHQWEPTIIVKDCPIEPGDTIAVRTWYRGSRAELLPYQDSHDTYLTALAILDCTKREDARGWEIECEVQP